MICLAFCEPFQYPERQFRGVCMICAGHVQRARANVPESAVSMGGLFDGHEVAQWTKMALEDRGQGQGHVQQKALGDLGIKTGSDVLRADLTCGFDGPHFLWSHRAPASFLWSMTPLLQMAFN